ncbi:hypothetical protein CUZ89_1824 [Enterococcus xinjiangensis]|nr:hypothetical protein [Enterococcus lactis]MBL4992016.1 hypothetical protein [Enterococcus lactis]MBL4999857.1 hypothetical protein [Enterococcus lactis]MBL5003641.1 hypothetical protein [Enterococcus lactis]
MDYPQTVENLRIKLDKTRMYEKGVVDKLWKRNVMMKLN